MSHVLLLLTLLRIGYSDTLSFSTRSPICTSRICLLQSWQRGKSSTNICGLSTVPQRCGLVIACSLFSAVVFNSVVVMRVGEDDIGVILLKIRQCFFSLPH